MAADTPKTDTYGEAAASGGLPQFDFTTWASQIFWLLLVFGVLYFILSTFILPRIGQNIADRTDRISDDLDQAANFQAQAEETEKSYTKILADARAKSMNVSEATRNAVEEDIAKEIEAAEAVAEREAVVAEARIRKSRDAALESVETVAVEAAGDVLEALTGKTFTAAKIRASLKT
ncbi:F0F1 ATP synthase subunit B' [Litorimonas sp. WD9-15]|uniref:F0F1 ATP synthase subunit B family protein n=1 Tax=Litorimonas sp. WD9-15 TaxID=3418716 RepID=UPI003D042B62